MKNKVMITVWNVTRGNVTNKNHKQIIPGQAYNLTIVLISVHMLLL